MCTVATIQTRMMLDPKHALKVGLNTHICATMLMPSICAPADCNACGLLRVYRYDSRSDVVHPDQLKALLFSLSRPWMTKLSADRATNIIPTTIPAYLKQTTRSGFGACTMAVPTLTADSTAYSSHSASADNNRAPTREASPA